MILKVWTSSLERQIARHRFKIRKKLPEGESGKQDATRRTAGRTRRGSEARQQIPRRGDGHRPCFDRGGGAVASE